jgi:hypothetical protein
VAKIKRKHTDDIFQIFQAGGSNDGSRNAYNWLKTDSQDNLKKSQLTLLRQNPSDANLRHTNASLVRNFFDTFGWHKQSPRNM